LEDLERAAQHGHSGESSRSRRWLWVALALVALLAVLFVIYQVSVPTEVPLQEQLSR
jgi:MYXO-CTERM domain-containing protein